MITHVGNMEKQREEVQKSLEQYYSKTTSDGTTVSPGEAAQTKAEVQELMKQQFCLSPSQCIGPYQIGK